MSTPRLPVDDACATAAASSIPLMEATPASSIDDWLDCGFDALDAARWADAEAAFAQALALAPDEFDALHGRGLALLRQDDCKAALPWLQRACEQAADEPGAWRNLALAFQGSGHPAAAQLALDRALGLAPRDADLLSLRVAWRLEAGQSGAALDDARAALALQPADAARWAQLAHALVIDSQPEAGLQAAADALQRDPGLPNAHLAAGDALLALDRVDAAAQAYARVRQLAAAASPQAAQAGFGEAWCHLLAGDWPRGLPLYTRYRRRGSAPPPGVPRWDGHSPLAGQRLLVQADEGLGDTLMLARFLPWAQQQGADVVLQAQPGLVHLLRAALHRVPVQRIDEVLPSGTDLATSLVALATAAGPTPATVPPPLSVVPGDGWRHRAAEVLAGGAGTKIGIAWSGNPANRLDRWRSLPLAQLLDALPGGLHLVGLQRDVQPADAEAARARGAPELPADLLATFEGTAALIEQLDLVITVDTSIAHLAGTLGKPTWLLLGTRVDWRWLLHREDTPWYPSMRLFRSRPRDDWPGLLARLAAAVQAFVLRADS